MGVIDRMRARLDAMVSRAVISRVNDALKTQRLQLVVLDGEPDENVEHFQPYGLSFVPPDGSEALVLSVGGDRAHTVAICAQHPDQRPKGKPAGTGGLYTAGAWRVYIDASGVVHIGADTNTEFLALANKVATELGNLKTAIVAAKGACQSGDGGLAAFTKLQADLEAFSWPASVAATKAKAT